MPSIPSQRSHDQKSAGSVVRGGWDVAIIVLLTYRENSLLSFTEQAGPVVGRLGSERRDVAVQVIQPPTSVNKIFRTCSFRTFFKTATPKLLMNYFASRVLAKGHKCENKNNNSGVMG
jgi:hypothetical protein